jgi:hypothetical protein
MTRFGLAAVVAVALAGTAQADVSLDFPRAGSEFLSQTNGAGVIPAGGQTFYMWTTGDFVQDSYSGVALASVGRVAGSFEIENVLGGSLDDMLVNVLVNGALFGTVSIPQCNYCFEIERYSFEFLSFAPVVGGAVTLRFELGATRAGADGSIAFRDGGAVRLAEGGVIPEPATWAMLIAGFGLVGTALRRRRLATA